MTPAALFALLLAVQGNAARAPAQPPATGTPAAPAPSASDWPFRFNDWDYPAVALRGEEQGLVRYRIEIGPDGRVSRCTIRSSSGSPALDDATCRIVTRRARFLPARDSDGNAVPDARDGEVIWRLPDE